MMIARDVSTDLARKQVVIVGGGPVGVALAIELGRRNISCTVVEQYLHPQPVPKGQNLTQRTMEHFHFWGIERALRVARTIPAEYGIGGVTAYQRTPRRLFVRLAAARIGKAILFDRQRTTAAIRYGNGAPQTRR